MKKENKNISGIKINDSIVMSVKYRRKNIRNLESLLIALLGYSSIILFFLNTFDISFNKYAVTLFSIGFAVIYGAVTTERNKVIWIYPSTIAVLCLMAFRYYKQIKTGFCLVFNIMYKKLADTGINYFKAINPLNSEENITIFLIFAVWILALLIFFFTVYRPNIIIVASATFPIIEICLYYGIEVPIIWTAMIIGYWFALLSICSSDLGEYFGGGGGFTRKDNTFFPKRKMKFKVTEKCGILIIAVIMISSLLTMAVLKISGYERSEDIKEQRRELKAAINSFSVEDIASSVSNITESLGFSFEYQDNRLGRFNKINYSGKTDLTLTIEEIPQNAIYLKGFTASEYRDNEWFEFESEKYSDINEMFETYEIYPQMLPNIFNNKISNSDTVKIKISSKKKTKKYYTPYGVVPLEDINFINDNSLKSDNSQNYKFEFSVSNIEDIRNIKCVDVDINLDFYNAFNSTQNESINDFCNKYENNFKLNNIQSYPVLTDYDAMMSMLVENEYRDFVYENYLSYPDNESFREIYNAYADIIENASLSTAQDKLEILQKIKDRMNSEVTYTLEPGRTPSTRDFVNYFLLENKKGYCVHYATSGVMLARMAGIPARYATGYVSVISDCNEDTQNPDGSYTIELPDNRSHAWAEIYIDGYGWIPFEFTAGYTDISIQSENPETTTATETQPTSETVVSTSLTDSFSDATSVVRESSQLTFTSTVTTDITESVTYVTSTTNNKNNSVPGILKNIFVIILILLLIFARRWIIIKQKDKKLNKENPAKRVLNNYRYVNKILNYAGVKQENMQYNQFAESVEEKLSEVLFKKGEFLKFNEIILKSTFGNVLPEADELSFLSEFSNEVSQNLYNNSNVFLKLYFKFVSVII